MPLANTFVYAGDSIPPYGEVGQILVKTAANFYYTAWGNVADIINIAGTYASISGAKIDANFGNQRVSVSGVSFYPSTDIRFYDADNSNFVSFIAPSVVASDTTWTLPSGDGTAGQVLGTNGSGVLYWTTGGGGGGGASVSIGTSPPASPSIGDIWFDSDAGRSYVYYDDGNSQQWVEMNPSWNGTFASGSGYTISFASGTVGAPSIYFPFSDTGLYMPADYQVGVTTSGIARFIIGTSSIEAELPVTVSGDLTLKNQADLRLGDADNSNYVGLQAPTTVASDIIWTLPAADATVSGYALISDASGTLSWGKAGGGAVGGGGDEWALEHDNTINNSYTISTGKNVISAGPLTVQAGAVVTVPSGSNWVIV